VGSGENSGNGLSQKMMDMGVAIAKLSTDLEWVKSRLDEIIGMLEKNNDELKEMVEMYQADTDQRIKELELKVEQLESFRDRVKGAAVIVSIAISSGLLIWALNHMFG